MDSTLRDGANVVGKGFSAELTELMLEGLTACRVPIIELGNAGGLGAYEVSGATDAEKDEVYLRLVEEYAGRGSEIGMFLNALRFRRDIVERTGNSGLSFLRVGANAGDGPAVAVEAIRAVKDCGLKAYYSQMKAYILTPEQLAEEAAALEKEGLDEITIMDSAGTMLPEEVSAYVKALKAAVSIPVGFHGHNNLGLSVANALAAYQAGADILDCGLMGMARSAGNTPTEVCVAVMRRLGQMQDIDLYGMLDFISGKLQPAMEKQGYHTPITPVDLTLGMSGCHSSFLKQFRQIAAEEQVSLFALITEVSAAEKKKPTEDMIRKAAQLLK